MSNRYEIRQQSIRNKLKVRGALLVISFISLLFFIVWFVKLLYALRFIAKDSLSNLYQTNALFQFLWDYSPPVAMKDMFPFGFLYILLLLGGLIVPLLLFKNEWKEKSALDSRRKQADDEMDMDDYKRGKK